MDTPESVHPVLFTLREVVSGNGFVAGVRVDGRGSLVHEEDGWWLYGVEPGILAEDGDNPEAVTLKFTFGFKEALYAIASEAPTYERFKEEVTRLFSQVNEPEASRWNAALDDLRAGRTKTQDRYLLSLPKHAPGAPCVHVQRLDQADVRKTPDLSTPNHFAEAA